MMTQFRYTDTPSIRTKKLNELAQAIDLRPKITTSSTPPANPKIGDLWIETN